MKRITFLFSVLFVCFATLVQAQITAPKPDPEFQKLQIVLGHWTYLGEYKPGPLGPGGKITGEYNYQLILKGFAVEGHAKEKAAEGETNFLEVDIYDPATKTISMNVYTDDGSRYSGIVTVTGNTVTWLGKFIAGGKEYQFREPFVLSDDHTTGKAKSEISEDGKAWMPFFEASFTKVKPAESK